MYVLYKAIRILRIQCSSAVPFAVITLCKVHYVVACTYVIVLGTYVIYRLDTRFSITSLKTWGNTHVSQDFRLVIENRVSHMLQPCPHFIFHRHYLADYYITSM